MPDIDNPDVAGFMNNKMRVFSDILVGLAQDIDVAVIEYIETVLPALNANGSVDSDMIMDDSETDSRTQLNKGEAKELAGALAAVRAAITADVFATLVKASVNPRHIG